MKTVSPARGLILLLKTFTYTAFAPQAGRCVPIVLVFRVRALLRTGLGHTQ